MPHSVRKLLLDVTLSCEEIIEFTSDKSFKEFKKDRVLQLAIEREFEIIGEALFRLEKVDEMMLALLWLTMFDEDYGTRAWKGYNWDHMDRLHEKGFIDNPKSKNKSVIVTAEGKKRAEELFNKYFGI